MAIENATTSIAAPNRSVVPPVEKSGNFSRVNFKGCQQRVFFYLSILGM